MAATRTGGRKPSRKATPRARRRAPAPSGLEFNHAMIYTADYARALRFYRDQLGFRVIEEYPGGYGRLRSPAGRTTIALHALEPGQRMEPGTEGLRLYFETRGLDAACARLAASGVVFDRMPADMPWGWRHAYLRDPDGHEISLYWAGAKRFRKTTA
jgi:catechol 2,3-dioxygenase-like lactoylglutathione lyase family enzyme